jgi:serine acetyltransferase
MVRYGNTYQFHGGDAVSILRGIYWKMRDVYWCFQRGFSPRVLLWCDLNPWTLPKGTRIPHPFGITVGDEVKFGENCFISPNVTIGVKEIRFTDGKWTPIWHGRPRFGNRVFIGAGATVFGDIDIGDDCIIGAGAVVFQSFEAKSIIVGNPARVVGKNDNI